MSDETSDPRQIAARRLRETVRAHLDDTALTDAMLDKPVQLSADDAMSAVNTVIASLAVDSDLALVDARRCRCKPPPAYDGPERDCPIHGEPEVMLDERDQQTAQVAAVQRAIDEQKAWCSANRVDVPSWVGTVERALAED